jgi:hypothetical protein
MNSTCGKQIQHRSIKAVIVEDTTCGVSLLTGTISGSNFAIPRPFIACLAGTGQVSGKREVRKHGGRALGER